MWFNYKLETIRVFLTRAFQVNDEYTFAIEHGYTGNLQKDTEVDHAMDIRIGYENIVAKATINELNVLVEQEIKTLARIVLEAQKESKPMEELGFSIQRPLLGQRMSRQKACEIVERYYKLKLNSLPMFAEVDEVRKIANAYKHDDGFSPKIDWRSPNIGVYQRYDLEYEKLLKYIDSIKQFLLALPGRRESLPEQRLIRKTGDK